MTGKPALLRDGPFSNHASREEICDDVCDDDDDDGVNPRVLSERSFNNGYYDRFFTEQNKLGSGGFGSVFLCEHVLDGVTLGA